MKSVDPCEVPAEQHGCKAVYGGRISTSADVELRQELASDLRTASRRGDWVMSAAVPDRPATAELFGPGRLLRAVVVVVVESRFCSENRGTPMYHEDTR